MEVRGSVSLWMHGGPSNLPLNCLPEESARHTFNGVVTGLYWSCCGMLLLLGGEIWVTSSKFPRWCLHCFGVAVSRGVLAFYPNGNKIFLDPHGCRPCAQQTTCIHQSSTWYLVPPGMPRALCTQTEYRPLHRMPSSITATRAMNNAYTTRQNTTKATQLPRKNMWLMLIFCLLPRLTTLRHINLMGVL